MRVVYTDEALSDLTEILVYIDANYPINSSAFRHRLRAVTARIGAWPESAEEVAQRPGVRMVPLIRTRTGFSTELAPMPSKFSTFIIRREGSLERDLEGLSCQQTRHGAGSTRRLANEEASNPRRPVDETQAKIA